MNEEDKDVLIQQLEEQVETLEDKIIHLNKDIEHLHGLLRQDQNRQQQKYIIKPIKVDWSRV